MLKRRRQRCFAALEGYEPNANLVGHLAMALAGHEVPVDDEGSLESATEGSVRAEVNPFWSEKGRGEAKLQSLRPAELPPLEDRPARQVGKLQAPSGQLLATKDGVNYVQAETKEMVAYVGVQQVQAVQPKVEEPQEGGPRAYMMEQMMAMVMAQNSKLQKELMELRQYQYGAAGRGPPRSPGQKDGTR